MRSGQRLLAILGACAVSVLLLASCAGSAAPGAKKSATPSVQTNATETTTPANPTARFVCANAAGSHAVYVYMLGSYLHGIQQTFIVRGCDAPMEIAHPADRYVTPIAFSTDASWLLISDDPVDQNNTSLTSCLKLVSTATRQIIPTPFCNPNPVGGPQWSQWYAPIAWAGPHDFYLSATSASDMSVQVSRVSVPSLAQTAITRFTWVATMANRATDSGIVLRQNALYYGGYLSSSEGGAWLHRYSLTTGTDTQLVRLGLAGFGDCQVADVPCGWTGSWDISPDAARIAYHNPGPTQSISDTSVEPGQPLYLAAPDGGAPQRLFPAEALGPGFNPPNFSPDGRYVTTGFNGAATFERLSDGKVTSAPTELYMDGWTAQPDIAVLTNTAESNAGDYSVFHLELFNVATGARTQLQPGTHNYVFA
jgi:hypothetical protein